MPPPGMRLHCVTPLWTGGLVLQLAGACILVHFCNDADMTFSVYTPSSLLGTLLTDPVRILMTFIRFCLTSI
jgi:hypothetical protein